MGKYIVKFNLGIEWSTEIEADNEDNARRMAYDLLQSTSISDCNHYNYDVDIDKI